MAKKTTTKKPTAKKTTAKKVAAKKTVAKKATAKKSATKKTTTKKKASRKAVAKPKPVKTGKGATPAEIGADVVEMIKAQAGDDAIWKKHFHRNVVSTEGAGVAMSWTGMRALREKSQAWMDDHIVHSLEVDGPYVGATGFGIRYTIDTTTKSTGQRMTMTEVGVYNVKNGKVVAEEFMYRF
ncbi:MAG: histone H1-like repetitive region-containing protein [Phycisphaeraceae bacterium]|nr:histone H1-like repetitive region-containing protein [Phycisphaerales bacterium]MCB9859905.1 histone H1-like repetitive region-containing protein [Phycisphaeraceae bacterium]